MRIAHLSDLHITEARLDDQGPDLERVVDDVLAAKPDLVLLTGDYYGRTVPHRPTPRERAALEPALVRLAEAAPVVALLGNHDSEDALGLAELLGGTYPIRVCRGAEQIDVLTPAGCVALYPLAYPTKRWILHQAGAMGLQETRDAATDALAAIMKFWAGRIERHRRKRPEVPIVFLGHFQARGAIVGSGEVLATNEIEVPGELFLGLDVEYGALGHLHARQEIAPRWWYVGDPWPVDFGERGPKGWHLVTIGEPAGEAIAEGDEHVQFYPGDGARQPVTVAFRDSEARPWITLDYRWATDRADGEPRWVRRPSEEELREVPGSVVRARLVVPDQCVASCPWDAELAQLAELYPRRVQAERVIEPTQRVRAPAVVAATTIAAKVRAYWATLASPPELAEQDAALEALGELESLDAEQIHGLTRELVDAGS